MNTQIEAKVVDNLLRKSGHNGEWIIISAVLEAAGHTVLKEVRAVPFSSNKYVGVQCGARAKARRIKQGLC